MIATYLDRRFSLPLLEFFCCLAAYLFIINLLCPTIGEDFVLTAVPPHESTASFPDFWSRVFDRIRMQAEGWNARIGEQASIVFGSFPEIVFDIFNTVITIGILHLMYRYAYKKRGGGRQIIISVC